VTEGAHGQLIEINTRGLPSGADANTHAGIAQQVYLHPGASYELSFDALMREEPVASDEDAFRYEVHWGWANGAASQPGQMAFKQMVPLSTIYPRTDPGAMQHFSTRFTPAGKQTTIAIWALKKWATENRELDVNLDNVVLRLCSPVYPAHPVYPVHPKPPYKPHGDYPKPHGDYPKPHTPYPPHQPPAPPSKPPVPLACDEAAGDVWYTVQRGDTLSAIAAAHDTTVAAIVAKNGLANPNMIYAGQKLCIPGQAPTSYVEPATAAAPAPVMAVEASPAPAAASPAATASAASGGSYRVQRGDTLSAIAAQHGTTVAILAQLNNLDNPNHIYAGQTLALP
jgi:LysM repeat protein